MGFQALMGRMDPYFCFARKIRSLSYLSGNPPLRWNCQLKWPWKFPLTFLRPARRVCRRLASIDVSNVNTDSLRKGLNSILGCVFWKDFWLTHQRVPFITSLNSFDFFVPKFFFPRNLKWFFFLRRRSKISRGKAGSLEKVDGFFSCETVKSVASLVKGSSLQGNQFLDVGKQCEAIDACTSQWRNRHTKSPTVGWLMQTITIATMPGWCLAH